MFGGFGGASSSPFGGFGQSSSAFGQASTSPSPFGAPAFGQSQPATGFGQPATSPFGSTATPAFGAASSGGGLFGATTSTFGAPKPAFGQSSSPGFGFASSAPAFGAPASQPAFGAPASQPAFGSAFGATSAPAFGAPASQPAFGQTLSGFGSTTFGATASPGGSGFGFGGGAAGGSRGTRAVAYRKTQETDQQANGAKTTVFFNSISCMQEYSGKSVEELRWEDYQDGVKGNTGATSPGGFGAPAVGGFGAPAAASPFGAPASSPGFGAATTPAFGAPASTPAFGFGASSTPAFGGAPAASTPAFGFGAASTPAFGASSTPAFGGFGATSAPAFGASSAPAFGAPAASSPFGAPSSTPAFGFGASQPAFGQTAASTPAFGFGASPAPAFGAAPAASPPAFGFGGASAPAFGASSTPAFGGFGATSAPASSTSLFGAASTPAFGATSSGGLFGAAKPASTPAFGFGPASTPAFGAASTPSLFGAPASSTSLFGAASAPAFGAASSGGLFGAASMPAYGSTPASGAVSFSFAPAAAGQQQAAGQLPGVATSPYGMMPQPPTITSAPEYKVGLTQRPAGGGAGAGTGLVRPAALIVAPRSLTPRSGVRMRPRRSMSATRASRSPGDFLAAAAAGSGSGVNGGARTPGAMGAGASPGIFLPRDNPRKLFIRDPLPSTEGATCTTPSPALGNGGTPGPAARTPGTGLRLTPGGAAGASDDGLRSAGGRGGGGLGGPSPLRGDGQDQLASASLRDDQLSGLLPSLRHADYYCEPSLTQLAAMGREDPASLAMVHNFTVGRQDVGSVRWLEPVDVRGLDLDATVQLSRGSVAVYLDDNGKPAVGQGLNKPAEVTMLKLFKIDKATGRPTSDPEAQELYRRRLVRNTAQQGSAFVGYTADTGTWRFRVEHFSRYGLLDSDDEEDDGRQQALQDGADPAQRRQQGQAGTRGGTGDISSDEDQLAGFGLRRAPRPPADGTHEQAQEQEDGLEAEGDDRMAGSSEGDSAGLGSEDDMEEGDGAEAGARGGAFQASEAAGLGDGSRAALAVALPARLGQDPEDLMRIRDGLFAGSSRPAGTKLRRAAVVDPALAPSAAPAAVPAAMGDGPAAGQLTYARQQELRHGRTSLAARNSWRKSTPAPISPPTAADTASAAAVAAQAAGTLLLALPPPPGTPPSSDGLLPRLGVGSSMRGLTPQKCLLPVPGPSEQQLERCLVDMGLFGGRSFRAGWAPAGGVLALPGGLAGGASAAHAALRCVAVGTPLAGSAAAAAAPAWLEHLRQRLEAALALHLDHSAPVGVEQGPEGGVPRWELRCSREAGLRQLTREHIRLCNQAAAAAGGGQGGVEAAVLQHEAQTWELLHVLFSAIQGDPPLFPQPEQQQQQQQGRGAAAMDAEGAEDEEGTGQLQRLAAFKRRAGLSHWLRDLAHTAVERECSAAADSAAVVSSPPSGGGVAPQLLALLSGHQLAAAAALAAASGSVRLATLVAQAGAKRLGQQELAAQLQVWADTGMEPHVSPALRQVYQLLAGQVDAVVPALQLDWRRALGMHLWYGCNSNASLADALESYAAAVEAGAAPPPLPLWVERTLQHNTRQGQAPAAAAGAGGGAFDTCFELLRLAATLADPEPGAAAAALPRLLARLLRPSGHTPDPLDHAFAWHLLGALGGAGVVPPAAASGNAAVAATHMGFIAQLESVGGLARWAIYAALHLPDDPAQQPLQADGSDGRGEEESAGTGAGGRRNGATREAVVRRLLAAHAPSWAGDAEAEAFFLHRLRLPAAWLAEARALWSQYSQDNAGRLDQLLAARDWPAAHRLLCAVVAPRWLLTGGDQGRARLEAAAAALERHAPAINAAGPGAAGSSWEHGAGVYAAFLFLRGIYAELGATTRGPPPALCFVERMAACRTLAERVSGASSAWGLGGASDSGGGGNGGKAAAEREAVYARMNRELARWLVSDAPEGGLGGPGADQVTLAAGLRGSAQRSTLVGVQLAAPWLAEQLG